MGSVELGEAGLIIDGTPIRVLSGSINYFRIVPEQWRPRLRWARYMGLNTIETYVPWNLHEPRPGEFGFDGILDLVSFLRAVYEEGLYVILRPGPYVCAELEFGGLPAWLLGGDTMRLRSSDPAYLSRVDDWFAELLPLVTASQHDRGGPIVAMQVENEYGAHAKEYGEDAMYLNWLADTMRDYGVTVPLLTSDQDDDAMVAVGSLPGLWRTMNFGSEPDRAWNTLATHQTGRPRMCMEFWNGWFDHWGEEHHTRDPRDAAAVLDRMLADGASVNFYMFCGGTNFGFSNGANHFGRYQPTITSYDYDAPLSEHGTPTKKFDIYRDVLSRYTTPPQIEPPMPAPRIGGHVVSLTHMTPMLNALDLLAVPHGAPRPMTMEQLGQAFGFTAYSFDVSRARTYVLSIPGVRDRAQVFVDGAERGILEREHGVTSMMLRIARPGTTVTVLVENLGRINYGPELADPKGILGDILLDGDPVDGEITMHPLPLDTVDGIVYTTPIDSDDPITGPVFLRGELVLTDVGDTFVDLPGFGKGMVWINGFNLGRYWDRGPQRTLYLPGPLLRQGHNDIVVLELHHVLSPRILLTDTPDLG